MRALHGRTCVRLLLDECPGGRQLAKLLEAAGHDVIRSVDAVGSGAEDLAVFAFAQNQNRVVLTFNSRDFALIGEDNSEHAGLVLIYQDNNSKDMSDADIVDAIANVESAFSEGTAGHIVVLNAYRW